jgi:hypothetical protein
MTSVEWQVFVAEQYDYGTDDRDIFSANRSSLPLACEQPQFRVDTSHIVREWSGTNVFSYLVYIEQSTLGLRYSYRPS